MKPVRKKHLVRVSALCLCIFSTYQEVRAVHVSQLEEVKDSLYQNSLRGQHGLLQQDTPELETKGNPLDNPENYPLEVCQGGCFGNFHCRDGLKCFFRVAQEPVIGCSGLGDAGVSYCYRPPLSESTNPPSMAPTVQQSGTQEPQTAPPTDVPTTAPTTTPQPTELPELVIVDDEPFGKCQGVCRRDSDCDDGLRCQDRGAFEIVPGCRGVGEQAKNYCYNQQDGPVPPKMPSHSFRLRLYWERGYFWQESYSEKVYCLRYKGRGVEPDIGTCRSDSTKFEIVYLQGLGDQFKVRGTNHCLDRTGNLKVTFEDCDVNNPRQRWSANWAGRRFDIRPVTRDGCVTQHHHPRSGELVFVNNCLTAHLTDTGFWNLYDEE